MMSMKGKRLVEGGTFWRWREWGLATCGALLGRPHVRKQVSLSRRLGYFFTESRYMTSSRVIILIAGFGFLVLRTDVTKFVIKSH